MDLDTLGELWRYELQIKEELQSLCIRVNSDMAKVDEQIQLTTGPETGTGPAPSRPKIPTTLQKIVLNNNDNNIIIIILNNNNKQ